MGFFFTLLYLLAAYITPSVLFGPLGEYHIEVLVVFLAIVTSVPSLVRSQVLRSPQIWAYAGMSLAIIISFAQTGWLGGAFSAAYGFMQPSFGFLLVAINFRTKRHLQWLVMGLTIASILFMMAGLSDMRNEVIPSIWLYGDGALRRIRGLGFVNDPNDFAQIMVSLIPALFLWRRKSTVGSILLIGPLASLLLVGMFFTHSRGSALALMAVIGISARRKIGTIPAAAIAGGFAAVVFAVGWSGGRDVSMEAGADRLDLWYSGIELIKAHPLFGVGVGGFTGALGMTAHNSVVVCAAEIGMVGLFFWVLLLFSTIRSAILLEETGKTPDEENETMSPYPAHMAFAKSEKALKPHDEEAAEAVPVWSVPEPGQPISGFATVEMTHDDIREMARILLFSLTGLLTAGWFLSRALSIWLFMYCGMIFAVGRMAAERGMRPRKDSPGFLLGWTFCIACLLVVIVSLILRSRNF